MARFDVYTFRHDVPLVVDVQSELFAGIGSRVVIPLLRSEDVAAEAMDRLKPTILVQGVTYRLITTDIVAIPTSRLGDLVGSLEQQRQVIIDAIDFLMQGF